ncbi:unnamed protein product [Paramecium primaurelia]|uniref:Uncharacterized protein n=1 Tax=Paramecium primaurelia TaxID=5886 RepID=A0A8S1N062_PARPR|nr:unnamed protein product [Paramecium primaurelia]
MDSHKEDVLHKLKFNKIIKNSPKTNFEECLNPPSFDESFFLVKPIILENNQIEIKQEQINQFLLENCEKWIETQVSTKYPAPLKQKQIIRKLSQFSVFIQILIFMKYLIDIFNILLNLFCGLYIPYLKLIESNEKIRNILYFLIFFHFFTILIQNIFSYLQIIKTKRQSCEEKFRFLNEITLKNLTIISFILIYIVENVNLILQIISLYYFSLGYKMIEISTILLIIQRKKFYKTLAIFKVIVYYIYFLHLFSSFFQNTNCDGDFRMKYQESLIININFLTFQANYNVQDSTMNFEVIINQIMALIIMFYTINVIIQIRSKDDCIQNQIKFDVYVLQYYIWHHKGQIFKKLKFYSQISNREFTKQQLAQQDIIKKIYQQIMKDNLKVLEIFSKQFNINLSSKVKSIRRTKDKIKEDKYGLYLILKGQGNLSFATKFNYKKVIESKQFVFGLINCFQKNISEVELELDNQFLLLYIKPEDFYSSLTVGQDFESFHMIKNKIVFEGETSLIDYRCWICNQFHSERKCKILKLEITSNMLNEQNIRMKFNKRFKKKRQRAFKTYMIYKQNDDATIDQSESSVSDSCDQFEIHADDGSGSQKFTDKNLIVTSTIQKDGYTADYIPDKLYEQLKSSHRNIQLQPSIQTSSQQIGEMLRSEIRSIPLHSSQFKFQDLLSVDDIDCLKEYVYFYPEFNISYIISLFQN